MVCRYCIVVYLVLYIFTAEHCISFCSNDLLVSNAWKCCSYVCESFMHLVETLILYHIRVNKCCMHFAYNHYISNDPSYYNMVCIILAFIFSSAQMASVHHCMHVVLMDYFEDKKTLNVNNIN